ncbi:MAG: CHASE3 domain-containing protein [Solirubrobacteraceae bacterium]
MINLERLVVDAETGLRGYVITGRTRFLQPTRDAQRAFGTAEGALARATAVSGAFVHDTGALATTAADADMLDYLPNLLAIAAHHRAAAATYEITLHGKQMVDDVRARAAALESLVSARERRRQSTARADATHSTVEAILVPVLLTAGTLLLGLFLGHLVLSRERARRRSEATVGVPARRAELPQTRQICSR